MPNVTKIRFVQQQGFPNPDPSSGGPRFSAVMFQPWVIAVIVAVGLITQSAGIFFVLGTVLALGALMPRWNLFDGLYAVLVARPRGLPPVGLAPPPRRFAQGMSATFMLVIGFALLGGHAMLAWIVEGMLVAALLALIVGRFCLGSYLYHLLTGNRAFANRTLPWGRS